MFPLARGIIVHAAAVEAEGGLSRVDADGEGTLRVQRLLDAHLVTSLHRSEALFKRSEALLKTIERQTGDGFDEVW